jgi:mono/diheme cytochrome c family protein
MRMTKQFSRRTLAAGLLCVGLVAAVVLATTLARHAEAGPLLGWPHRHGCAGPDCVVGEGPPSEVLGGTWYWLRSPEEEKQAVMGLYNRYCIRCHAVDGRGVWDIPGIPNFTNVRWQETRTDGQIARIILEGRGAVMPPFRGVLTLEEAWAMARYLRTLVPGTEVSRPDLEKGGRPPSQPKKGPAPGQK